MDKIYKIECQFYHKKIILLNWAWILNTNNQIDLSFSNNLKKNKNRVIKYKIKDLSNKISFSFDIFNNLFQSLRILLYKVIFVFELTWLTLESNQN